MKFLLSLLIALLPVGGAVAAEDAQAQAVNLINAHRGQLGLVLLERDPRLEASAQNHARDLDRSGRFSHAGTDGSDLGQRLTRAGYGYCAAAENIAQGQSTASEVVAAWIRSEGHRRNLENPELQDIGLFVTSDRTWVLVMGRTGC